MLIGFAAGYGAMRSDVQHLKVQVDRIYDRMVWQENNTPGPAPPVEK